MDYCPDSWDEPTFTGLAAGFPEVCRLHGKEPVKRVAFEGTNTGRRFYMCSVQGLVVLLEELVLLLQVLKLLDQLVVLLQVLKLLKLLVLVVLLLLQVLVVLLQVQVLVVLLQVL
ncbi:hypothetical protein ACQ4PT_048644 [Festuca glaucescens]